MRPFVVVMTRNPRDLSGRRRNRPTPTSASRLAEAFSCVPTPRAKSLVSTSSHRRQGQASGGIIETQRPVGSSDSAGQGACRFGGGTRRRMIQRGSGQASQPIAERAVTPHQLVAIEPSSHGNDLSPERAKLMDSILERRGDANPVTVKAGNVIDAILLKYICQFIYLIMF